MQPELRSQADVILNFWFEECSYGPYPEVRSRLQSSGRQTRHTDRSLKEPVKLISTAKHMTSKTQTTIQEQLFTANQNICLKTLSI